MSSAGGPNDHPQPTTTVKRPALLTPTNPSRTSNGTISGGTKTDNIGLVGGDDIAEGEKAAAMKLALERSG
jgi:hypothetical protein